MTAQEARILTDLNNSNKYTIVHRILKQIRLAAENGLSWISYKNPGIPENLLTEIEEELKTQGYEIGDLRTKDYIQIEW